MLPNVSLTARYLGLRVAPHGRGPDTVDCWGLVVLYFAEAFGIAVDPLIESGVFDAADRAAVDRTVAAATRLAVDWWHVIPGRERHGDLLLLGKRSRPLHVAIVLDPLRRRVLHADLDAGVVVEPWDGPTFGYRIHNRLRHPTLAALHKAWVHP